MVVVDSSVWIDYLNGRPSSQTDALDGLLGRRHVVVGDLILAEVLQGFRRDRDFHRARRAENYRRLRRLGVTVRKTIDVMIGTYCIARRLPLLHSDTDFEPMTRHLGLR